MSTTRFALPTETQWEKAARGTASRDYPWGNNVPNNNSVNYYNNEGDTTEVGFYPEGASPYGALDMAGNVWEWVRDWYGAYDQNETINPFGPNDGEYRVLRGGSWNNLSSIIRSTYRNHGYPTNTSYRVGFRCVFPP